MPIGKSCLPDWKTSFSHTLEISLFQSLKQQIIWRPYKKTEARDVIETAHRLAQLCGQVTRYAIHAGIMKHDAAGLVKGALSRIQTTHYAAITRPDEFGLLLADIEQYPGEPVIAMPCEYCPMYLSDQGNYAAQDGMRLILKLDNGLSLQKE